MRTLNCDSVRSEQKNGSHLHAVDIFNNQTNEPKLRDTQLVQSNIECSRLLTVHAPTMMMAVIVIIITKDKPNSLADTVACMLEVSGSTLRRKPYDPDRNVSQ